MFPQFVLLYEIIIINVLQRLGKSSFANLVEQIEDIDWIKASQSRIIPSLLANINQTFFADILEESFNYKSYLLKIEKYLNQIEDLKFKRNQKQHLIDNQHLSSLVKLILFLIMRHQIKHQFVSRILQLEDQTQIYLMCQIKRAQSWLESKLEFKQVYSTISALEEENQILIHKLSEAQSKLKQVQLLKNQFENQNLRLTDQHRDNLNEKAQIIQQLGISHPKDYIMIYRQLVEERNDLLLSHSEFEWGNSKLIEQNKQMQQKIIEDKLIIEHLDCQLSKYKDIYSYLTRFSLQTCDFSHIEKEIVDKQNVRTLESTRILPDIDAEHNLSQNNGVQLRDQQQVSEIMHTYHQDLVSSLQQMYSRISNLNNEICDLKSSKQILMRNNKNKQQLIQQFYRQQKRFCDNYRSTMKI